jgi:hypothetical protein
MAHPIAEDEGYNLQIVEKAVVDGRQGAVFQVRDWTVGTNPFPLKILLRYVTNELRLVRLLCNKLRNEESTA